MKKIIINSFLILVLTAFSCKSQVAEITGPVSEAYTDTWKFHAGEGKDSLWMDANYDDSEWINVLSTKLLKDQSVSLNNGFGWYRKSIQLSDSLKDGINKHGAAILHLGRLAATDEVYINGKLVGKTGEFPDNYKGYHDGERNYLVAKENINFEGDNVIAIKFHDGWNIGGFLEGAKLSVSTAQTKDKLSLNIAVADSDYIFMSPDPIKITVNLENKNEWDVQGQLVVQLTTDDYRFIKVDSLDINVDAKTTYNKSFNLSEPNPGFYRYTIQFKRNKEIACEKEFNVGYEPEKIESPIDAKDDFQSFWDNNLKELAKVDPDYKLALVPEYSKIDYDMYLVEMKSLGDELIRGYYAKPKREGKHPVIVEYMGYGSQPYAPNQWWDGFAYFVLSIRGQALNQPTNRFGTWITYGLDNKDNYYYRGAFLDVIRALDFVCSRQEIDADRIAVRGGSQGGTLHSVLIRLS